MVKLYCFFRFPSAILILELVSKSSTGSLLPFFGAQSAPSLITLIKSKATTVLHDPLIWTNIPHPTHGEALK